MMKGIEELKEKIKKDTVFAEKLGKAETYEAFLKILKEEGFSVTEEELRGLSENGEIADEELEQISGGISQDALQRKWWIFW